MNKGTFGATAVQTGIVHNDYIKEVPTLEIPESVEQNELLNALTIAANLHFKISEGTEWSQGDGKPSELARLCNKPGVFYYHGTLSSAQSRLLADLQQMHLIEYTVSGGYEPRDKANVSFERSDKKAVFITAITNPEELLKRAGREPKRRETQSEAATLISNFTGIPFEWNGEYLVSKNAMDSVPPLLKMLADKGALRTGYQFIPNPEVMMEDNHVIIPEFNVDGLKKAIGASKADIAALLTQASGGHVWTVDEHNSFRTADAIEKTDTQHPVLAALASGFASNCTTEDVSEVASNAYFRVNLHEINLGALKKLAATKEATALLTKILGYEWTANGTTLSAAKPDSQDHSDCANLYTFENGIFREFPKGVNDTSATALTINIDQIDLNALRLRANTAKQEIQVGEEVAHDGTATTPSQSVKIG